MKSKFALLVLLSTALFSCKKTINNVESSYPANGTLSYKLVDDQGKGIPNVKVNLNQLTNSFYNYLNVLVAEGKTDQNGIIEFGELNAGNYLLSPDSIAVNKIKYLFTEPVQVLNGVKRVKETHVTDYSGTIKIKVSSGSGSSNPLKNIGVLLIPYQTYYAANGANSLAKADQMADFKGVTDETGLVTFKVPSDINYIAVYYNTQTNQLYNNTGYNYHAGKAEISSYDQYLYYYNY